LPIEKAQSSYDEKKISGNCIFSEGSKNLPEDLKLALVMSDDLTTVWSCGSQTKGILLYLNFTIL
jgi:hypothetical protein